MPGRTTPAECRPTRRGRRRGPKAPSAGFCVQENAAVERFRWIEKMGRIEFAPQAASGLAEFRIWSGFFDPRQRLIGAAGVGPR